MPAKSIAQHQTAGVALSAKRGLTKASELKGAAKEMEAAMTEAELEALAAPPHKGLPDHKT